MKTTSTPAVEWPPGGAAPGRGTASQGRATTDFGALLDQTQARTAPAEGHKRDGDKKTSVAPRDERQQTPVAERAPEQPKDAAAAGEPVEQPQGDAAELVSQPQDAGEQKVGRQEPAAAPAIAEVVLPVLEAAPVAAPAEPVVDAPVVNAAPVVGPQPVAEAPVAPVVATPPGQPAAAPVAPKAVVAQPVTVPVSEQTVVAEQTVAPAQPQQPTQIAQPQQGQPPQGQPAQGQPAQGQPAQGQPQQRPDAAAPAVLAERPAEGGQPQAGAQQQQPGAQQPNGEQPVVQPRGQQQSAAPAAESRVQPTNAPSNAPAAAPVVNEPQQVARPDVAPRPVPVSQAAEAVENAIRIGQARGVTHARMSLRPAELGGVEIRLAQTAQGLSATVVADGAQAAQLLQQAGHELRRSLEAQGIQLHQLDISYSGEGREGARSSEAQADGGERRSSAGADDPVATDGDGLNPTDDITVKETLELPDGVLVDVLA